MELIHSEADPNRGVTIVNNNYSKIYVLIQCNSSVKNTAETNVTINNISGASIESEKQNTYGSGSEYSSVNLIILSNITGNVTITTNKTGTAQARLTAFY